ncbi:MAG: hypothetical protein AB7G28_09230 [Pirellulales bacterium]
MSRPQRRQKYIDSQVQGALARRIIFHWLVFVSVAAVAALLLQVLSDPFQPAGKHIENLWYTHGPFLIVMLFLLPVFVVDTIKISHRFAGPIFSLRRAMREVAEGQPPRKLQFRQNDFWHELAQDYNALLARLAPGAIEESAEDEEKVPAQTAK